MLGESTKNSDIDSNETSEAGWFGVCLLILGVAAFVFLRLSHGWLSPDDFEQKKEYLTLVTQVITGVAVVSGLTLTYLSVRTSQKNTALTAKTVVNATRQLENDRETKVAELFYMSSEQLGDPNMTRRIAGLFSLERISITSDHYYQQCIEVVCAFIRLRSEETAEQGFVDNAPEDLKVAVTVLSRRRHCYADGETNRLNLRGAYLKGMDISFADFALADFTGATFDHARLHLCNLERAMLRNTSFIATVLINANLRGSVVTDANFSRVNLLYSNTPANFRRNPLKREPIDPDNPDVFRFVRNWEGRVPSYSGIEFFEGLRFPTASLQNELAKSFGMTVDEIRQTAKLVGSRIQDM